jgi:hypothetical protein
VCMRCWGECREICGGAEVGGGVRGGEYEQETGDGRRGVGEAVGDAVI